ncbi:MULTISPECIES: ribulose-phosphate 3-epimerase [Pseudovibrio]|uniref:ribulose-phosphate 3-epimerase n=1 Tax=Stappiaceae TaxID=2821832 RepID=UPI0023664DF9|nr:MULTISPECIES: ribulose-phosphate 3-epimerase [Pseudovibrio]MDD7908833.1 ribulose-phosphate 3-epimerase [Pseudovibrio exalbescens]MDX5593850.1 ribulose-phosphate 3-epimerase [Pseudovibrio sp. SPO723]
MQSGSSHQRPGPQDLISREALVAWLRSAAPHLSVGLMAANAMAYGAAVSELEQAGVNLLHYDVMDGVFCPQMTAGAGLVKATETTMLKDVHLMVDDPLSHIQAFITAGADIVHVHAEGTRHLHRALVELDVPVVGAKSDRKIIRSVALNPGSSAELVRPVIRSLEMVTLIAVDPGWSGGSPNEATAEKVKAIRTMAREAGVDPLVCIDGGITPTTFPMAAAMQADIIVSGSAVFKSGKSIADNLKSLTTIE